jgi:hypothetical protein
VSSTELEKSARPAIGPRIGLWGRFDVASFGDLLIPRVFEHEMRRRLVGAAVQPYAPLGPRHPIALDGGLTAKALGAWSRFRAAELARQLDCVVIGGGDVIHTQDSLFADDYGLSTDETRRLRLSSFFVEALGPSLERSCPVAWNAVGVPFAFQGEDAVRIRSALGAGRYLSVRDVGSRKRLLDAGIEARVEVVPDPTLLVGRVFPSDLLGRRLEYLRFMDWFPSAGQPIVLQGGRSLVPRARSIARSLLKALQRRTVPIVLVETEVGRGEGEFYDALTPHLSGALFRLPASAALSDVAAVLAHASLFAGTSFAAGLAAYSFGVPVARLDLLGGRRPTAWPVPLTRHATATVTEPAELASVLRRLLSSSRPEGLPRELERRLDRHFDVLAEIAESAVERRPSKGRRASGQVALASAVRDAERRIESWHLAYEARGEQLLHQRFRLAEALERREAELQSELDRVREEISRSASELAASREEKTALVSQLARSTEAVKSLQAALDESHEREVEAQKTMHRLEKDLIRSLAEQAHAQEDLVAARATAEAVTAHLSDRTTELALERAERERENQELFDLRQRMVSLESNRERLEGELSEAERELRDRDERRMRAEQEKSRAEKASEILQSELERLRAALERVELRETSLRISRDQLLHGRDAGGPHAADMSGSTAEGERLRAELARVHAELRQLANLKIFRYSAPLRALYGRFLSVTRRARKIGP